MVVMRSGKVKMILGEDVVMNASPLVIHCDVVGGSADADVF